MVENKNKKLRNMKIDGLETSKTNQELELTLMSSYFRFEGLCMCDLPNLSHMCM